MATKLKRRRPKVQVRLDLTPEERDELAEVARRDERSLASLARLFVLRCLRQRKQ